LFIESAFVLLEIFVEHIFAAEFVPASEVVDFHVWEYAMFFEYPVYLFFLAPDHVPVIVPGLSPLAVGECIEDCVLERGFEFNVIATSTNKYGGFG
jgi:hypothetical protein